MLLIKEIYFDILYELLSYFPFNSMQFFANTGEPSLLSMNELIKGCSPIPELVEQELLKQIFHQDVL